MLEHMVVIALFEALLAGLAGFRLASLLVSEDGPLDIFEKLRAVAGVPSVGEQLPRPFIGGVLSCYWCASVWTSSAMYALGHWGSWTPVALIGASTVALGVWRVIDTTR